MTLVDGCVAMIPFGVLDLSGVPLRPSPCDKHLSKENGCPNIGAVCQFGTGCRILC